MEYFLILFLAWMLFLVSSLYHLLHTRESMENNPSQEYTILPYNDSSRTAQASTVFFLRQEWGLLYTDEFIRHYWSGNGDVFFVMASNGGSFLGCLGVDFKFQQPFLTHLYIHPSLRKQGYASKLLRFAENYILQLGYADARLWCKVYLISFYQHHGYRVESKKEDDHFQMVKYLNA